MSESGGLLVSLKRLACTLLAILQTRLELLSNEIEEELLRLALIAVFGIMGLFCFCLAVFFLAVFIVALFWDSYRLEVFGGLTAFFFVGGLAGLYALRRAIRQKSKLFSSSLAELSRDRDRLAPRHD